MARLTKQQRTTLALAERHLTRALDFIMSERIAVARVERQATTTLHYVRPDGTALYSIAKDIGSDLTGLPEGLRHVRALLDNT